MLKLHYSGHLMWRTDLLEKTLMLGKFEGRRRKGWQRMRWLDGITNWLWIWVWASSGSWWYTGQPGMLQFMGSQSQTWLSNWTELNSLSSSFTPTMHRFIIIPLTPSHRSCMLFSLLKNPSFFLFWLVISIILFSRSFLCPALFIHYFSVYFYHGNWINSEWFLYRF